MSILISNCSYFSFKEADAELGLSCMSFSLHKSGKWLEGFLVSVRLPACVDQLLESNYNHQSYPAHSSLIHTLYLVVIFILCSN